MTTATFDTLPISAAPSSAPVAAASPGVAGGPRVLLRLEGVLLFAASTFAYAQLGGTWGFFLALLLVPDLSLLGYLAGPRIGALVYNAGHSTLGPALLAAVASAASAPTALLVATIWLAHVGMDRSAGYGLKYASAFADTHLGRAGKLPVG